MTDRDLAGCALSDVLALLEKATPGPWRWSENGNIVTEPYADNCEVGYIYTEHEDDDTEPANSAAICAAVNFLRQYGPELLSRSPSRDAVRLDYVMHRVSGSELRRIGIHTIGGDPRSSIDAAIAAAERDGRV